MSSGLVVATGLLGVACVAVLDYLTGTEISFSIAYLAPIMFVTWRAGRSAGLAVSGLSGGCWLAADILGGHVYQHPAIPYWNAAVRLGFFVIVTITLAGLREARARHEELSRLIVHDLRTPLTNMKGALDLAHAGSGDAKLLDLARSSCEHMERLVDTLLDTARLEAGRLMPEVDALDLGPLVDSAWAEVETWAAQRSLRLLKHVHAATVVRADRALTRRVLVNLLGNAVKFSPPGAEIRLRTGPVEKGAVAVSVENEGPGVPREMVDRIFDKYVQVQARQAGAGLGSGLGLTFCRLAVEAQGGHIRMDSHDVGPTTVTFTLPRA